MPFREGNHLGRGNKGIAKTPEHRAKLAAALTGRKASAETVAKLKLRIKHGLTGSPEYRAYHGAKNRCRNSANSAWANYGGRGIEFRFSSFPEFMALLGRCPAGLTLDRIDVNGHYEPGNVRWATHSTQTLNRRPYSKPKWRERYEALDALYQNALKRISELEKLLAG